MARKEEIERVIIGAMVEQAKLFINPFSFNELVKRIREGLINDGFLTESEFSQYHSPAFLRAKLNLELFDGLSNTYYLTEKGRKFTWKDYDSTEKLNDEKNQLEIEGLRRNNQLLAQMLRDYEDVKKQADRAIELSNTSNELTAEGNRTADTANVIATKANGWSIVAIIIAFLALGLELLRLSFEY